MNLLFRFSAFLGGIVCLIPTAGLCAEPHPLWELGAGVGVLTIPDYLGADQQRNYVFPIPYFVYRGEVLQVDREKIRGLFFKTDRLELDFSLSGSPPVRSGNNKARAGMPDLDPTLEFGPKLDVLLKQSDTLKLTLQLPVRQVIAISFSGTHNAGLIFNPILNLDIKAIGWGQGWNLGLSGGPLFANGQYNQYFYGVDTAYVRPGRPAYAATGGYGGTQATVSLSKRFPEFWVGAFVRVYDLHGAVFEDSPLLQQQTAFMAGFGVSWIITQSDKMVMSDN
jgi:outer membrane scaffolding protein for murein synthesis (MipA/OmpV family)